MSNPVILIAEDHEDTREALRQLLEPHGYDVIGAEDSLLAYGLLSTAHPSLIIVDIVMPKVDGIGLIRWIRAHEDHAETPIIAMSANGDEELEEAKAMGATAVARKPEDITKLPGMVNRLLDRSGYGVI